MLQAQYKDLLQHPDIRFDVPENGGYIEVKDAATHDTLAWVKSHDRASVEQVIARSQKAQTAWKAQTALQRADVLWAWFDLMQENKESLAQILTAEQGKPLAEARGEIGYAASFIRWFAEQARRIDDHVIWQQSHPTTNASHVASVMTYAAGMAADYIHWNNLTTHNKSELCLGGQSDHANAQEHLIALGHQSVFEDYLCLSIIHLKKPNVWRWVEFFAQMMMEIKVINGQDVLYKARESIPKLSQEELELLWCAIERKLR